MENIRIFTHESIIHSQMQSIEKLLDHRVNFAVTLNSKGVRSKIEFLVTEAEIRILNDELGYKIYRQADGQWFLPDPL